MANVLHSSASADHGTPPEYVELARHTQGGLDLDPFSSSYWNHWIVKASTFYDEVLNGFERPWFGRMLVNPPGVPRTGNVRRAWERLINHWISGAVDSAVWIGFSLEQLTELQSAPTHPLQLITGVPGDRVAYMVREGSGPPSKSKNPTHGSYITLLPTKKSPTHAREQVARFCEGATRLGVSCALVRPL